MIKILEIDDNNNSNIFKNSEEVDGQSVKVKNGDNALTDLIYDYFDKKDQIVVDAGGGNDSTATIELIKDTGIPFTYIVPVGSSMAQLENAKATYDLISDPKNTIFALNGVHDLDNLENEFPFWFGNVELGIESFAQTVKSDALIIKYTPLFELAALDGITINELAKFSYGLDKAQALDILYKESKEKTEFKRMKNKWTQSVQSVRYLDEILKQFKKIKTQRNIAVVSSKGGVGKSTIAWHLAKFILENQEQ